MLTPKVITLSVGQLQTNCYIYPVSVEHTVIIDPGDDGDFIIQKLLTHSLTPIAILLTHGHFDHVLAAFELQLAFNCPVYIHTDDLFLLKRMRETAIHFTQIDPGPPPIIAKAFTTETELLLESAKITLIPVPGHTPGGLAFYDKKNKVVFTGDIFSSDGARGGVDHQYSNKALLEKSIKKILRLPKFTTIYPGHGESFLVSEGV